MIEANVVPRGQGRGRRASPTLPGLQDPLPKQRLKGGQELVRKGVVAMDQLQNPGLGWKKKYGQCSLQV